MKEQEDGSLIVRFRAGGLLEMAWHLMTSGDDIEVLEPRRLQKLLRRLVASTGSKNTHDQQTRKRRTTTASKSG
jgi:predicted DNA-binding transcriptional regulator YafY